MNIFVLDTDPVLAAQQQCDRHICKMTVESAQMLSTAHRLLDGNILLRSSRSGKRMVKYWELPDDREQHLYNAVHMGHPCTVWTMATTENYDWHYRHFIALCDEYTHRYGKVHATDTKLRQRLQQRPNNIKRGPLTPFALAMGAAPQCINENDPVQSYKDFYQTKQDRFKMVWSKRDTPDWFVIA